MHLPYAPAAWRVLSDSTGKWTISLILISQNGQNCWAAHLAFVCPPPICHFRVHLFRPCFVRSSELPTFETCVMYTGHTQRIVVTDVGSSRRPQVAASHTSHLSQLHRSVTDIFLKNRICINWI
jgi:hypothetical protein